MKALLTVIALAGLPPSVHPWPIGPGPRYLPPARTSAVAAGRPVGSLTAGAATTSFRLHLELFANRKVVVVPAGIGVSKAGGVYPIRTTAPGGVFEVASGSRLTLGDLFRVWGQQLGPNRLVSFTSSQPVRAYVNGKPIRGPLAAIPLTRHAEIVLELGAYVAPHPFFLFPGGGS
jgi:hypothetical protein